MKTLSLILMLLLLCGSLGVADSGKPVLVVGKDGLPSGHGSPEGAACDLARAFINHDPALFKSTCIQPFGGGQNGTKYAAFLKQTVAGITADSKKKTPSPQGPISIGKLFAARHLTQQGPASYGYSMFGFSDVEFVDVGVFLRDGSHALNRTFVIKDADGKWYVDPAPAISPLLSEGLDDEGPSTEDFSEAYTIKNAKS